MTSSPDRLICLAVIAGAFGVKAEVKIKSFTEEPAACLDYGPLLDQSGKIILTPLSSRPVKGGFAVITEEVKTREQAESLKGTQLFVPRHVLPETDEDDFYYEDLIGLDVKTTSGQRAGKVIAVHEFGAGDMLEILPPKAGGKQPASFFHTFTKAAVPKVDLKAGRIIIHIIEPDDEKSGGATS